MADEREVLTWSDFGVASRVLATEIAGSGFRTDIVIAVARGGLLPAGALAYALGTKAAGTLNAEFSTDVQETCRRRWCSSRCWTPRRRPPSTRSRAR